MRTYSTSWHRSLRADDSTRVHSKVSCGFRGTANFAPTSAPFAGRAFSVRAILSPEEEVNAVDQRVPRGLEREGTSAGCQSPGAEVVNVASCSAEVGLEAKRISRV